MVAQYVEAQWQLGLLLASSHVASHHNGTKPPLLCFRETQLLLAQQCERTVCHQLTKKGWRLRVQEQHKYACALSPSPESTQRT